MKTNLLTTISALMFFSMSGPGARAQQGPIITIHNDDKPSYESPFDKPTRAALPAPSANMSVKPVAIPTPQPEQKPAPETAKSSPAASPVQTVVPHRPALVVHKAAPVRKERNAPEVRNNAPAVDARPQVATVTPAVAPPPALEKEVTNKNVESSSKQPAEAKPAQALSAPPALTTIETEAKKPMPEAPQIVQVPVLADRIAAPKTVPKNTDSESQTPWALFGILAMLIALVGYALRAIIFKKDPALNDPWFKPAK